MTAPAPAPARETPSRSSTVIGGHWSTIRLAVSTLLCVLALGMLAYKLPVYPQIGSDEWWLLGRAHMILHEFTFEDRVSIDTQMRGVTVSQYPPMNIALRYAVHKVLGADVDIDRTISAVQFALVAALFCAVAWQFGARLDVALLGLPAFLLTPAVFYVARTVRYEQDLFFLGSVAVVISFFLTQPSRWRLPLAVVSGTAAGMASVMHVFGIGFGASIAVAYVALWLLGDRHRLSLRVVGVWLASAAVPVALTAMHYLSNAVLWQGRDLLLRPRESQQLADRMEFLRGLFPPLVPGLPNRVTETLNALRWGLMPHIPELVPQATAVILTGIGVIVVIAVLGGLGVEVARRLRRVPRAAAFEGKTVVLLTLWLLPLSQIVLTAVRPHTDYTVYVHGTMMLALFGLVALGTGGPRIWSGNGARWLALAALVTLEVGYLGPVLGNRNEPPGVAIGAQMRAMERVSAALGLETERQSGPSIYADLTSWPASGNRHAPLFDFLILERAMRRPQIGAIVFDPDWYAGMVATIAPSTGNRANPDRRREQMASIMDGMELGAVLRIDPNFQRPPDERLWFVPQAPSTPVFGIVAVDGSLAVREGQAVADRIEPVAAGMARTVQRVRLDAGDYFAFVSGPTLATASIDANVGRREFDGRKIDNFPQAYGGARVWVALQRPADVRFVIETTAPTPGDVRLRIWRVGDVPPNG